MKEKNLSPVMAWIVFVIADLLIGLAIVYLNLIDTTNVTYWLGTFFFFGQVAYWLIFFIYVWFFRPYRGKKTYHIKEGNHTYGPHYYPHYRATGFEILAEFHQVPFPVEGREEEQINKLYGLSWGGIHENSIRVGWRYNKMLEKIDLFAYWYKNGIMDSKHLTSVYTSEIFEVKLTRLSVEEFKIIVCKHNDTIIPRNRIYYIEMPHDLPKWGRYSMPYYGGEVPASHDVLVTLQVLK